MLRKTLNVEQNQRVLVFTDQQFTSVLSSGTHKLWQLNCNY
jgi:hypothetical protein